MRTIGRHSLHKPGDKHYPFSKNSRFRESNWIRKAHSKGEAKKIASGSQPEQKHEVLENTEPHGLFTSSVGQDRVRKNGAEHGSRKEIEEGRVTAQEKGLTGDEVEWPNSQAEKETDGALEEAKAPGEHTAVKVVVECSKLQKLGTKPNFIEYLREVWGRRDFILTDARYKAFRTTKDYRLWRFWLVAQPLLDAAMYGLLFGVVLKTSRGIDNFIGFVILGVTFFTVLTRLIGSAPGLVKNSKALMQAFSFPRASIIFSHIIRLFLDCLPPCIVAVMFALVLQWRAPMSWTVILVVPIYFLMIGFGAGLLFILARITAFIPDFKVIIDVLMRAWFFGSGIFFSIDKFVDHPTLHSLMTANPGYIYISNVRAVVLSGEAPDLGAAVAMLSWGVIPLIVGVFFFWKAENRYSTI